MIGKTLGHYRIVERIGAGGMGEVYRARDEHLERDVAIKVLPAGTLADEAARKRFRKEALALSRLNHPNIATVFDFDSQDGTDFLVMEFVAGESLTEKLAGRPLLEKEVLRIGAQLAEGLAAAHEQHIIHRDLKPGNLRLTADSRLKILDFGLAKLLQPFSATAATESLTESQVVVGTLPYMAPEQLQGELVDARTDIYAAGVVLYEMATGRRPFQETLSTALTDAILHRPVPPPGRLQPDLSPDLERIILKCLEKDPENRYQSAKELLVDLRRLALPSAAPSAPSPRAPARGAIASLLRSAQRPGPLGIGAGLLLLVLVLSFNIGGLRDRLLGKPAAPKIESLAVLPLENLSRDPEQDYFADGMTEALITELSKISALKVISRTSAMQYKGAKKPMPQIARELDVDGLVEGSVQREGDQVRITVQLIHGPTDKHLWAESYQRELRGVLALQSEVAQAIAREIRVAVTPAEETRLAETRAVNPEAHEAYLKGRYHWNKRTREGLEKGIEYFEQAIEKDPNYAPAYAGLADGYNVLGNWGYAPPRDTYPRGKAAAMKALELDEELAEAHASLARNKTSYDWDWSGARQEFERALQLDPNYASAHYWYSYYYFAMGRLDEAAQGMKRAAELDPLSVNISMEMGRVLLYQGQYDAAIEQERKTLEMEPNFDAAHTVLARAYLQKGRYADALTEAQISENSYALPRAYLKSGNREKAQKVAEDLKELSKTRYVSANRIASAYIALDDRARAFEWLGKAFEERSMRPDFMRVDPMYDNLRSDPRFQDLLRRAGLPQ